MVEVVLPQEFLGLVGVGGHADIAGQSFANYEDVSAVLALQDDSSLSTVDDAETGLLTGVAVAVVNVALGIWVV